MTRDSVWRIRWTDVVLVACVVAWGMIGLRGRRSDRLAGEVVIYGPDAVARVPLADVALRRVRVPGPLGETVVEIEGGVARIVESPCRAKVCMRMGIVSSPGDWVACVPNRVFVKVEASGAVDAVTR